MIFKWKDAYNCNIEEIDKQHRKLFEIGSRIYDVASLSDDNDHYDEIMEILDELKDYTVYHFNYEEELMDKYGYPELDMQKIEHNFFVKKIQRIERKDIDGEQREAVMDIIAFVADWVSNHILKSDMQYKDFFNGRGVR